jgi:2-polyprenyl-6-methoxyphenol hydroxylase-like FAD-dependent oxidoreductase
MRQSLDVLIIGAGPTGLTIAAQLRSFGTRFRIVDRLSDRVHESRALAIQARTLEVLQGLGVGLGDRLAGAGRTTTRLMLHFGDRVAEAELGGFQAPDTPFPFILFLSQAHTERILNEHLADHGVGVERGVELGGFEQCDDGVVCTLRHDDGREERVRTAYLVGCDGAHSTVRKGACIPFEGGEYLQDFLLGDVEADGALEPDVLHSYAGDHGVAMFFPLGSPTTWRVIAMSADGGGRGGGGADRGGASDAATTGDLSLAELQVVVDGATGGAVRLRDPAWLTHFRLHHRQTGRYRAGRIFLAGDAAHIHSPVGAQGMNTGMQDAWNLGWKLALVARGRAGDALLDSYEAERWPVGRALLRTTDRIFSLFTRGMSASAPVAWFRREVVSRVLPRVLRSERLRTFAFGFISELRIRYRGSPAVTEGKPALAAGPRAGDRLPDAPLIRDGRPTTLHQETAGPAFTLFLVGDPAVWDEARLAEIAERYDGLVRARVLGVNDGGTGVLADPSGEVCATLGVRAAAPYLVRPDGYISFGCGGHFLRSVAAYLARWLGWSRG